jgi:hypothetical protein
MLPKTNFPNACHEIFKGFPQREKHSSTLKLLFRSSLTCNNNQRLPRDFQGISAKRKALEHTQAVVPFVFDM